MKNISDRALELGDRVRIRQFGKRRVGEVVKISRHGARVTVRYPTPYGVDTHHETTVHRHSCRRIGEEPERGPEGTAA